MDAQGRAADGTGHGLMIEGFRQNLGYDYAAAAPTMANAAVQFADSGDVNCGAGSTSSAA